MCFVLVVYMLVSVLRTREALDRVIAVVVGGGCIVAVGALIQMKTGVNIFDDLRLVLPLDYTPIGAALARGGHLRATASAGHPIELGCTMSMLLPFAVYLAIKSRKRVWWLAFVVLLLGEFASGSKTGMLGVAAMIGVFLWLRPRETLRFWPALLPMLVVVHFVAPGALGGVYGIVFPSGGLVAQQSTTFHGTQLSRLSRVGTALHEFSHSLPGEGYGTRVTGGLDGNFQASAAQTNNSLPNAASLAMGRGQLVHGVNAPVLDDQWLKTLLETGLPRRTCVVLVVLPRDTPAWSAGEDRTGIARRMASDRSRCRAPQLRDLDGHVRRLFLRPSDVPRVRLDRLLLDRPAAAAREARRCGRHRQRRRFPVPRNVCRRCVTRQAKPGEPSRR